MILKMTQDLEKTMEKMQKSFTKDQKELKNKQMNNMLEGINSRITEAERINDLEDRMVKITDTQQNTEKKNEKNEDRLRDLWDKIKHTNIHIIGVPEGEEIEKEPKKMSEEMIAENFPNMGKEIANQVQEGQRVQAG